MIELLNGKFVLSDWFMFAEYRDVFILDINLKYLHAGKITIFKGSTRWYLEFAHNLFSGISLDDKLISNFKEFLFLFSLELSLNFDEVVKEADRFLTRYDLWMTYE